MMKFMTLGLVVAALAIAAPAHAQDVDAGEKVFKRCSSCHAVGEGAKHKIGPELNDLFGRVAGSLPDYNYSKAMVEAGQNGLVWNAETLAPFLHKPKEHVAGKDPRDRRARNLARRGPRSRGARGAAEA